MRICVMANALAVHTQRWASAYAERGHEVHVLSIRYADIPGVSVQTICVGPVNSASVIWSFLSYLRLLFEARLRLRRLAPDIIHAHYSVTHGVIAAFSGFHPLCLSVWGRDVINDKNGRVSLILRILNRYALRRADLVSSTSVFMLGHVQALVPRLDRVEVVPFGVDAKQFAPRDDVDRNPSADAFRIGFIKTLKPKYGPDTLIRAMPDIMRDIPNARLIMAGRGPMFGELRQMAQKLGVLAHVQFVGFVPHKKVPDLMRSIDVLVNCSRAPSESFGVVILEASACAIPIVATRVGGVPEVCRDGETGLLVEPNDSNALAQAVVRLAKDPELRRFMGQSGRRFVIENYVWQDNVTVMLEHLGRLAEQYQRTA